MPSDTTADPGSSVNGRTFGFHPLLGFVDHGVGGMGEPVAELLRPGKAGSNTAADHVTVLDAALAQVPAALRARDEHGRVKVLVRTDAAGATREFAAHLTARAWSSPSGPASPTSTWPPRWRCCRRRRGRRPIRPASRAPPRTGCRSNRVTGPGSPRPPGAST